MESSPPLISVCLITYNHAPYIRQAIDSVLMQETRFTWDLIIADDFSTDGTREILHEYKQAYPERIKLILQEQNVGAERNWFDLLAAPVSKYIAYFEGDDYWSDPLKLQKQVDFLEAHLDYAGSAHQAMILVDGVQKRPFRENVPADIGVNDLVGGRLFHTASFVFRRSALDLLISAPRAFSGDRLLNFCVAITGKIRFLDDCMCVYRWHDAGISSGATVKAMRADLHCIPHLKAIYPSFPRYRYTSYVYAAIGMLKSATLPQRLCYLFMSFLFSFSYFPENILFVAKKAYKMLRGR